MKKRTVSKRSGNRGKDKGSAYERKISEALSLWVSSFTRKDIFWRTAVSGGRATKKGLEDFKSQVGDICAIHPMGQALLDYFIVECKFYSNLRLHYLLFGRRGYIEDQWVKPRRQAAAVGKFPFVVLKQNQQAELIWLTLEGWSLFQKADTKKKLRRIFTLPWYGVHAFLYRDVLSYVDFSIVRELHEKGEISFRSRLAPHR
jgi:hypothetical protein